MDSIKVANGWIWTVDFWYRKRQLYQPRHNHRPKNFRVLLDQSNSNADKLDHH